MPPSINKDDPHPWLHYAGRLACRNEKAHCTIGTGNLHSGIGAFLRRMVTIVQVEMPLLVCVLDD